MIQGLISAYRQGVGIKIRNSLILVLTVCYMDVLNGLEGDTLHAIVAISCQIVNELLQQVRLCYILSVIVFKYDLHRKYNFLRSS